MIQRDHDENFKWKATFSLGHASRQQVAARSGPCALIFPYLSSSTRNSLYRRGKSQSNFYRIGKTLCRTERASRKCRTTVGKQMLLITWFTSSELMCPVGVSCHHHDAVRLLVIQTYRVFDWRPFSAAAFARQLVSIFLFSLCDCTDSQTQNSAGHFCPLISFHVSKLKSMISLLICRIAWIEFKTKLNLCSLFEFVQQSKGGILSKANENCRLVDALRQSEHHVKECRKTSPWEKSWNNYTCREWSRAKELIVSRTLLFRWNSFCKF